MLFAWFAPLVLPLLFLSGATQEDPPGRPNIVLILSDDQGYGDFGFLGNERIKTPFLDAMAERSAVFPSFYVTPVCATTRASLMTGRYHPRTGVTRIGRPLLAREVTLAERLAEEGYATGLFGKWHLGDHYPHRPMDQGFDEVLTFQGGILGRDEPVPTVVRYTDPALLHNASFLRGEGYATDIFFDAALDWIEEVDADGRNFFAYIPTNAPHGPFDDVPSELYERYLEQGLEEDELARIYAMISKIDENVGKLFARLENLDLLDETLVLYLPDNGPNGRRYTAGLRGAKSSILEGGIRVPLLAHLPGRIPAGSRNDIVGAHIDLFPTIVDLVGGEPGTSLDGRSFRRALEGEQVEDVERDLYFAAHEKGDFNRNYALRRGPWKLVHSEGYSSSSKKDRRPAQLFDVKADPSERRDLASENTELVEELEKSYASWIDAMRENGDLNPPLILPRVGDAAENPVVMTRGMAHEELSRESIEVEVARNGSYEILVRFAPAVNSGDVFLELTTLSADGKGTGGHGRKALDTKRKRVAKGSSECTFVVRLKRGSLRLVAGGPGGEAWQFELRSQ